MEHPEIGKYHLQLPSYKLSRVPPQLRMSGPLIGEHNEYVYRKLAGFSQEEYEQLQKDCKYLARTESAFVQEFIVDMIIVW